MRILDGGSKNVVAAYDDAKQKLVVVVVNLGDSQTFQLDMPLFSKPPTNGGPIRSWSTKMASGEDGYRYSELGWNSPGDVFEVSVDADTVQTLEFDNVAARDYYPIPVNATWAPDGELQQSDFFGGFNNRSPISDVPKLANLSQSVKVQKIWFRSGDYLDYMRFDVWDGAETLPAFIYHGGESQGTGVDMELSFDEYWTSTELCQANRGGGIDYGVYYIKATTSQGHTLEAGHRTSDCRTFAAPDGWQVIGAVAWEGWSIDGISFVYGPQ
jgi:hypothetical protein